jgi:hypothetical protein
VLSAQYGPFSGLVILALLKYVSVCVRQIHVPYTESDVSSKRSCGPRYVCVCVCERERERERFLLLSFEPVHLFVMYERRSTGGRPCSVPNNNMANTRVDEVWVPSAPFNLI